MAANSVDLYASGDSEVPGERAQPLWDDAGDFAPSLGSGNKDSSRLVIFFSRSLTEAPLPDPTPTPPHTPKRTRNGPKTDPKRSQTEPKRSQTEPKRSEIKLFGVGRAGGLSGQGGGVGVVREKEYHYSRHFQKPTEGLAEATSQRQPMATCLCS